MRENTLSRQLRDGSSAICGWISIDSPYLAEIASHAGYDAVTVDLQHGMFGLDTAIDLIRAVGSGPAVPLARCPSLDAATIGKLLDGGAYGIVCPSVDTAEMAADFVSACRYPPIGTRSFGPSRGLLYGGSDYAEQADTTIQTWAMIESAAALRNLDAILATTGLDGVYVGPNDLALALGETPGLAEIPAQTAEACRTIAAAARASGVWAGIFTSNVAVSRLALQWGYQLVTPGNDAAIVRSGVAERIAGIRGASVSSVGGGY